MIILLQLYSTVISAYQMLELDFTAVHRIPIDFRYRRSSWCQRIFEQKQHKFIFERIQNKA